MAVAALLYFLPLTGWLVEAVARRCGEIWDGLTSRLARENVA